VPSKGMVSARSFNNMRYKAGGEIRSAVIEISTATFKGVVYYL
jgi:hypothetical protein